MLIIHRGKTGVCLSMNLWYFQKHFVTKCCVCPTGKLIVRNEWKPVETALYKSNKAEKMDL